MSKIKFCKHAELKFKVLKEHGFPVSRTQVIETIEDADKIEKGQKGRVVAQKKIDEEHVLRVVYEKIEGRMVVITFYPGRREYYEN